MTSVKCLKTSAYNTIILYSMVLFSGILLCWENTQKDECFGGKMSFISILGENGFELRQNVTDFLGTPLYFNDLNLVQIVDMIRNTRPEYDLKKYYYKNKKVC